MKNKNPLEGKLLELFNALETRIKSSEDKKLAFTIMLCGIDNDDFCDKMLSMIKSNPEISAEELNKEIGKFLEPIGIIDE